MDDDESLHAPRLYDLKEDRMIEEDNEISYLIILYDLSSIIAYANMLEDKEIKRWWDNEIDISWW